MPARPAGPPCAPGRAAPPPRCSPLAGLQANEAASGVRVWTGQVTSEYHLPSCWISCSSAWSSTSYLAALLSTKVRPATAPCVARQACASSCIMAVTDYVALLQEGRVGVLGLEEVARGTH